VKTFERLNEAATPHGTVLTLYRHDHGYTMTTPFESMAWN